MAIEPTTPTPEPASPAAPKTPTPDATPVAPEPAPPPAPEPTPEPTPTPDPEPAPAPADWNLRDAAKASGLNVSEFDTDESLGTAMLTALGQAQRDQAFVKIGQQFAPFADKLSDIQKWQEEQAAPKPEPTPEPVASTFEWDAPEYDPKWESMVERDERGFYKPPSDIPALQPIADKMNAHRQFQANTLESFTHNPQELINKASADSLATLKAELTQQFNEALDERFAKQTAEAEMSDFWNQRERDFWQHDEQGQAVFDAQGQAIPTDKGRAAGEYNAQFSEKPGWTKSDIREAIDTQLELDTLRGRFGEQQTPAAPTPTAPPTPAPPTAPKPANKKQKFLDRAGKNGSRGGSVPDPTAPQGSTQNTNAKFSDITKRIADEQGVPLGQ